MKTKYFFILLSIFLISFQDAFSQNTANDGDWSQNAVILNNTPQADLMIRLGDIDNLGFGFENDFDPFCGKSTPAHIYPWLINPDDVNGMDRIILPSSYVKRNVPCGIDGYAESYDTSKTSPVPYEINMFFTKELVITSALIQIFVDDFQSPTLCSRFQVKVNSMRFKELEQVLSLIDETGQIGKVITLNFPTYLLGELKKDKLIISIDDPVSGAGDGYAIDFIKILINPKPYAYLGTIKGKVVNEKSEPIAGAIVETLNKQSIKSASDGVFKLHNIYAGLNILKASAEGYLPGFVNADVICSEENAEDVVIKLRKKKSFAFNGKSIFEGDAININNIQFKQNSFELSAEAKTELNKIYDFLAKNPEISIELSGHTSSEGDALRNIQLSKDRVFLCKEFLVKKGIKANRIVAIGYGAENPIAPNDTEQNRIKNRRVEMKILKF